MPTLWNAPRAQEPIQATVTLPGSKSQTNRAYILAALADSPSTIHGALQSRDTDLMAQALSNLGTEITSHPSGEGLHITPRPWHGATIDCGLAGTIMRFLPCAAGLATGTVRFDGDPQARKRPLDTVLRALPQLGVQVEGTHLPFHIHGQGSIVGGEVAIDASASSQFISGLLLAAARFHKGLVLQHTGNQVPSTPHIDMTVSMLREAGVEVYCPRPGIWEVAPTTIAGHSWIIEPDLSNATPFLAAAAVTGGEVRIPHWPAHTTQAGDAIRDILTRMGAEVHLDGELVVRGTGALQGIDIDMHDIGELAPTVAALAVAADSPSRLRGIAHLRGHETDRLAALAQEISARGGRCIEHSDGLEIIPTAALRGGVWHSYADHRMATAGAILGLLIDDLQIENIETTAKTLPGFSALWQGMIEQ